MSRLDGKQLKSGSVPSAALNSTYEAGLLKAGTAVSWSVDQNAGGQKLTNLAAPVAGTDAARLQDVQNIPWKQACRAATTANITLSGAQTIDGVSVIAGDRVLVKDQSTGSQNGIYVAASGSWTRAADADSAAELQSCVVAINEGTANADKRFAQTADNITVGSTTLTFIDIGGTGAVAYATKNNKKMAASATASDFDSACATTLTSTPTGHGWIEVFVNGMLQELGDGVKTTDCYFSADGGTTAKSIAGIAAGDTLYWVGSVAGFQLATTDIIDFAYAV